MQNLLSPAGLMRAAAAAVVVFALTGSAAALAAEVRFPTRDNVTIHGDVYENPAGKSAPLVLLFHQGGGNGRAEYGSIMPVLLEHGYSAPAIDQP